MQSGSGAGKSFYVLINMLVSQRTNELSGNHAQIQLNKIVKRFLWKLEELLEILYKIVPKQRKLR